MEHGWWNGVVHHTNKLQFVDFFNRQAGTLGNRFDIDSLFFKIGCYQTLFFGFAFSQSSAYSAIVEGFSTLMPSQKCS